MATDFTVTIKSSGGSYTTLSSAETAGESDISTSVTTSQVFAISEASEAVIPDGTAIKGQTSGATGTLIHATTTQVYIISVSGTFQAENIIKTDDSGSTITLDDTGDVIDNFIFECHAQDLDDNFALTGWTTGSTIGTHGVTITVPVGQRHDGTDRDLSGQGFKISSSGNVVIRTGTNLNSFTLEWVNVEGINQSMVSIAKDANSKHLMRQCVLSRTGTTGNLIALVFDGGEATIENCIVTVADYRGLDSRSTVKLTMSHCTFAGENSDATFGILLDNDNIDVIKNTVSAGFVTQEYFQGSGSGRLHRNNATTDGTYTAEDTDASDSITVIAADEFVSVSELLNTADFHLKSGGNLEAAGEDSLLTTDIDDDTRATTPDIGADEFVVAVAAADSIIALLRRRRR